MEDTKLQILTKIAREIEQFSLGFRKTRLKALRATFQPATGRPVPTVVLVLVLVVFYYPVEEVRESGH